MGRKKAGTSFVSLNFASIKFSDFRDFWPASWNFVPARSFKTAKSRSKIPTKLNTCRVWDSLFPNIWSKYGYCILHISTYSHDIRVSVTYLITATSINNRTIDIRWDFCFLFVVLAKSKNVCIFNNMLTCKMSWTYKKVKHVCIFNNMLTCKMSRTYKKKFTYMLFWFNGLKF